MLNSFYSGGVEKQMRSVTFMLMILYPAVFALVAGISCMDAIARLLMHYCGVFDIRVLIGGVDIIPTISTIIGVIFGWKVFDSSFDGLVAKLEKEGKFL